MFLSIEVFWLDAQEELRLTVLAHRLQPQARAVGVGQLAHRREDEVLQLADVPLGRQRDADAVQLLELTVLPARLLLVLPNRLLQRDVLHRQVQQVAQRRRGGVGGKRDRDVGQALGRALPGAEQDQGRRDDGGRVLQPRPHEAELGQHLLHARVVEAAQQVDVEDGRVGHACYLTLPSEFWR